LPASRVLLGAGATQPGAAAGGAEKDAQSGQSSVWPLAGAVALAYAPIAWADTAAPVRSLGIVIVTAEQPTSLPTQIPTTTEGATREQIERSVNAADSEDALKYFPSLLVRKRYVGDYNHAVLSSRASGTGNSARSAVYADGILLSNFLGNGVGGLSFPPRWGLVTPEEIDRVDVMYGPFAAAYPGNSVGAVVDYATRMPRQCRASDLNATGPSYAARRGTPASSPPDCGPDRTARSTRRCRYRGHRRT